MTTDTATDKPLWLAIEDQILAGGDADFAAGSTEATIHKIAGSLDEAGYNVSRNGGNLLELRRAVAVRIAAGRPMLTDFNDALATLTLDDVSNTWKATVDLATDVGESFPAVTDAGRRQDILAIVEATRLDLLVNKAKGLDGDKGARLLIAEDIDSDTILDRLGIDQTTLDGVHEALAAEAAAKAKVASLLEEASDKSDEDKARHLITNDIPEAQIVEYAGLAQSAIDGAKAKMEEEIKEKERLAAEEAALKKAEAEGPSLDSIPADEMLEHLESIEELMDFTDDPGELRTLCEQSSIPKALIDIAVENPDKLEELQEKAEG